MLSEREGAVQHVILALKSYLHGVWIPDHHLIENGKGTRSTSASLVIALRHSDNELVVCSNQQVGIMARLDLTLTYAMQASKCSEPTSKRTYGTSRRGPSS